MRFRISLARFTIFLLLLVTLVKGVVWSILVPPWHAPDESFHFHYGQMIERAQTWHPSPTFGRAPEIGISYLLAQVPRVRFNPLVPLDLTDRIQIADERVRLQNPLVKENVYPDDPDWVASFRNFTYDHPPLYFLLIGAIQASLEDQSILVRILVNRWFSVFLGVLTVALAYRAGKEIWRDEAWACFLATLVSFQPMLTFMTAVINDGALGIAMMSACTVIILRVIRLGWTVRRAAALAILCGLSLLARSSLVILIPLLLLLLFWNLREFARRGRITTNALIPIATVLAISLLIGGWWYKSNGFDNSDTRINFFITGITELGTSWRQSITNYDWFGAFRPVLGMYWGNFGWLDTPFPEGLYLFLTGVTAVAIWTALWWLLRHVFSRDQALDSRQPFIFFILGIQTIFLILLYMYLDFRFFNIGGVYRPQGRYFLPPIIGQMTWLTIGLVSPAPARLRHGWMWLVALGMVALNIYSLFSVITLRYYGARNIFLVADRAALLQPISSDSILILCAILFFLAAALVLVLWRAFENSPTLSEEPLRVIQKTE